MLAFITSSAFFLASFLLTSVNAQAGSTYPADMVIEGDCQGYDLTTSDAPSGGCIFAEVDLQTCQDYCTNSLFCVGIQFVEPFGSNPNGTACCLKYRTCTADTIQSTGPTFKHYIKKRPESFFGDYADYTKYQGDCQGDDLWCSGKFNDTTPYTPELCSQQCTDAGWDTCKGFAYAILDTTIYCCPKSVQCNTNTSLVNVDDSRYFYYDRNVYPTSPPTTPTPTTVITTTAPSKTTTTRAPITKAPTTTAQPTKAPTAAPTTEKLTLPPATTTQKATTQKATTQEAVTTQPKTAAATTTKAPSTIGTGASGVSGATAVRIAVCECPTTIDPKLTTQAQPSTTQGPTTTQGSNVITTTPALAGWYNSSGCFCYYPTTTISNIKAGGAAAQGADNTSSGGGVSGGVVAAIIIIILLVIVVVVVGVIVYKKKQESAQNNTVQPDGEK